MKYAIIFNTKSGITEDCANEIKKGLKGEGDIINLSKKNKVNLDNYSLIVIGTPIYAGQINRKIKKLCIKNEEILRNKEIAFYTCGLSKDEDAYNYLIKSIPINLKEKAIIISHFGGELRPNKLRFPFNIIAKKIMQNSNETYKINKDNIDKYINGINTIKIV